MYMSDLMVDADLFTKNGSLYFKRTIEYKKTLVPTYSIRELKNELGDLEFRQRQMNEKLQNNGIFNYNSGREFTEADKLTYQSYRNDVSQVISMIKNRLLELGAGIHKKSRRRVKSKKINKKRGKTRKFRQ